MQNSRYVWLTGIITLCLFLTLTWETPQVVFSALADPSYSDSPQITVQRFWNLLDSRQIDLAKGLFDNDGQHSEGINLLDEWENIVQKNALLGLQRVEFLDVSNPKAVVVKVTWSSSLHEIKTAFYSFDVRRTNRGWRIWAIKQVNDLSFSGGDVYGELFGTN